CLAKKSRPLRRSHSALTPAEPSDEPTPDPSAAWGMLLASFWSTYLAYLGLAIVLVVLLLIDRKLRSSAVIEP
ncbi:MAG: hypothetical protein JWQ22_1876, partial [Devosia sp.]|nr:hypothetical protein [Devosia sp.]